MISLLGAGGMGEVYKARDTRLDRLVAITVLREHLATDPNRRARFDREGRAISKLNHPNICTLFDVGHDNGVDYIVIELAGIGWSRAGRQPPAPPNPGRDALRDPAGARARDVTAVSQP